MTQIYTMADNGTVIHRQATQSEIDAIKAQNQKELLENASSYNLTKEDIIMIIAQSINITLPDGTTETADKLIDTTITLEPKLGQKWVLEGTAFVLVDDPDTIGTSEDNYIIYYDGCPLINNAFYKKDDAIQVYMNGEWLEW